MNRYTLLTLHIISLVLLGFGWVKDILHINVSAHYIIDVQLFDEKRSVIGTLKNLWETSNYWPFLLVFLFGILVPIVKSVAMGYLLVVKNPTLFWMKFVKAISKWAMADVFAISIFVAFLAAGSMENTKAEIEIGFYFFSAYVLLSALIAMYLPKVVKPVDNTTT